jgi:adenylate kinase
MAKVVTVFGLSGVGKSWMISRYAEAANVAHIQASQLMRDARAALVGRPVTSENLRRGPVLDNQILLTDAFAKVLATELVRSSLMDTVWLMSGNNLSRFRSPLSGSFSRLASCLFTRPGTKS